MHFQLYDATYRGEIVVRRCDTAYHNLRVDHHVVCGMTCAVHWFDPLGAGTSCSTIRMIDDDTTVATTPNTAQVRWFSNSRSPITEFAKMSSAASSEWSAILQSAKLATDICGENPDDILATLRIIFRSYMDFDQQTSFMGAYLLPTHEKILVLGPFVGPHTVHTFIPLGVGVVGTCVKSRATINIPNVKECGFYLECCEGVKSELVLPITTEQEEVIGALDLDSQHVRAYGPADEERLGQLIEVIRYASLKLTRGLSLRASW